MNERKKEAPVKGAVKIITTRTTTTCSLIHFPVLDKKYHCLTSPHNISVFSPLRKRLLSLFNTFRLPIAVRVNDLSKLMKVPRSTVADCLGKMKRSELIDYSYNASDKVFIITEVATQEEVEE